jgi:hypothetical protein
MQAAGTPAVLLSVRTSEQTHHNRHRLYTETHEPVQSVCSAGHLHQLSALVLHLQRDIGEGDVEQFETHVVQNNREKKRARFASDRIS